MIVVQGQYTLLIDGKEIPLRAGEEYFIPRGLLHGGDVQAGTRTIHELRSATPVVHSGVQGSSTTSS